MLWHCECVCGLSEDLYHQIPEVVQKARLYNFNENKALDIYASACGHFGVMPKTDTTKLLVEQAISQLRATSAALAALKAEMQSLAASLPEYPVVMGMFGVGPSLGPQLMAEIGDVRRFHSKKHWWPLRALMPRPTNPAKWMSAAAAFPSGVCLPAQDALSGDECHPATCSNG